MQDNMYAVRKENHVFALYSPVRQSKWGPWFMNL